MTEPTQLDAVLGSGAGGPLTSPTPWIWGPNYIYFNTGGVVIGNPGGLNKGMGTLNVKVLYIDGVVVNLGLYLPYTGGTLTGKLTLNSDPTANFDAATKRYVDTGLAAVNASFASFLPLAGGTLTGGLTISSGTLTLNADPTSALQATTKQYVDNKFTGLIAINDAPSDGTTYGRNSGAWTNVVDAGTY